MDALAAALRSVEVHVGLAVGSAAVVLGWRARPAGTWTLPAALAGLAVAAASLSLVPPLGALGLVSLGVAAVPFWESRSRPAVGLGLLGLSVASTGPALVLGAAGLAGMGLREVDDRLGRRTACVVSALAVAGVWITVPDTEEILLVAGVALPVLTVGVIDPLVARSIPLPTAIAVIAPVAWAAVDGGRGRQNVSLLGVLCFGVLLVAATLAAPAVDRRVTVRARWWPLAAVLGQVAAVVACRWAAV